jgi:hypothetical protein
MDFNNLKPLKIEKEKGKFRSFTNAAVIQDGKDFQPYLGKKLTINIDRILSVYPSEDEVGTMIFAIGGEQNWKVLEDIETVINRIND